MVRPGDSRDAVPRGSALRQVCCRFREGSCVVTVSLHLASPRCYRQPRRRIRRSADERSSRRIAPAAMLLAGTGQPSGGGAALPHPWPALPGNEPCGGARRRNHNGPSGDAAVHIRAGRYRRDHRVSRVDPGDVKGCPASGTLSTGGSMWSCPGSPGLTRLSWSRPNRPARMPPVGSGKVTENRAIGTRQAKIDAVSQPIQGDRRQHEASSGSPGG